MCTSRFSRALLTNLSAAVLLCAASHASLAAGATTASGTSPSKFLAADLDLTSTPNNCNLLLKQGVFDKTDVLGTNYQQKVFLNRFCSAHYSSLQQAQSDSLNANIPIEQIMVGFGFSGQNSQFQQDYQTLCSQQDSFSTINQSSISKIRVADATLAQTFEQCVAQSEFTAYLTPTDSKQFQIVAAYHPKSDTAPHARVTGLDYDRSTISCSNIPSTIGPQGYVIDCTRKDATMAAQLALNTQFGSTSFQFPAVVPQAPVAPSPYSVGDIVMSFFDETTFNSQHPGQTWRLCAGGTAPNTTWATLTHDAPLPDCQGRYPREYKSGLTPDLGQTQEDALQRHTHALPAPWAIQGDGQGGGNNHVARDAYGDHPTIITDAGEGANFDNETRPKTIVVNFFIRVN
ncbi:putative lipoprotein [Burkholderia pseudomallei]|uniref:hypothetical protein n=1 Tax=Burkholderia pseudomallei TaxID=28450 RepID=UPI000F19B64C|nr:hypothetical protein [Burkholderia pseudomallei]CAJ3490491.1 putative lipoprotein [Burkholderia pseudomallei]CAJ5306183.1 putative lipoprotein [Burkholderia pseudomallei]CAJ6564998.1 putative lipoprotein [Burkholderia pseudomallei]CAJ8093092.1 putative lipoprotein [Burkholderia pseudomallei]VBM19451.1 Uncharacterised protein [Burkholderia pseudomallei]